ncbi:TPA: class II glutamine amidotransferase, partial [Burkholderia cenocepacia]
VLEKLRNPSLDASASAPRAVVREALATAADGDSDDAIDF